ncbi:hypothetical protein L3i22_051680 [Actinoplanes sp. L3-i22]|nr:hypothetical protein L3i22_051680 [Actinoplanes sp. L3-i22]
MVGRVVRGPYTPAMDVLWSATEPGSRRFRALPVRSDPAGVDEHFRGLRRLRIDGYIEAEIADIASPQLSIGFRGDYAVIHLIVDTPEPQSFLLAGDGSVPDEADVQVPFIGRTGPFHRARRPGRRSRVGPGALLPRHRARRQSRLVARALGVMVEQPGWTSQLGRAVVVAAAQAARSWRGCEIVTARRWPLGARRRRGSGRS